MLRELDLIRVKGKSEPVTIFEVMRNQECNKKKLEAIKEMFELGLSFYRKQEFDKAINEMIRILQVDPQDGPASVFLERCGHFTKHPPAQDWNGIWTMQTK
jgi:adenylate cyclase